MIIETSRLRLRHVTNHDASFILALVNDPDWLQHIGDRGVRTLDDARTFIADGPMASYEKHGYGLWLMELLGDCAPIGLCGLLNREYLQYPDLGYALLPDFRGQGLAREACRGVLQYASEALGMTAVEAIVAPGNIRSLRLLEHLGFDDAGMVTLPSGTDQARLLRIELGGDN